MIRWKTEQNQKIEKGAMEISYSTIEIRIADVVTGVADRPINV